MCMQVQKRMVEMTSDLATVDEELTASNQALEESRAAAIEQQSALDRMAAASSDQDTAREQLQQAIASQDRLSNEVDQLTAALVVSSVHDNKCDLTTRT
jgi:hypothetical protein